MKRNFLFIFLLFILLLLIYFFFNLMKGNRIIFSGRASGSGSLSNLNSFILGSPLSERVGGGVITVTVYLLDETGRGVSGKEAQLVCLKPLDCQSAGLTLQAQQKISDDLGRVIYSVTANSAGVFLLEAKVDGVSLPQSLSIAFQ